MSRICKGMNGVKTKVLALKASDTLVISYQDQLFDSSHSTTIALTGAFFLNE